MSVIYQLMRRATGGKKSTISAHIRRLEFISKVIKKPDPRAWKCKDLQGFLNQKINKCSKITVYEYWLSIRRIATLLGRWQGWEKQLRGEWSPDPKNVGRPAKLPYKSIAKVK